MPDEPLQFWIRNDKGKVWGPLTFATIEILVDNGAMPGKLQASRDGLLFVFPGRLPEVRDAFPKELWGDSTEPLEAGGPSPIARQRTGPPTVGAPRPAAPEPAAPAVEPPPKPAVAAPAAPPAATPPTSDGVPASGDLVSIPPFRLYYLAATTNLTGKLTLTSAASTYEVFFKKGSPESAKPLVESADLGAFLVEKGVLKPEQLADARKLSGSFGGEILNALFGLQLLNPADAFKYIGEHALTVLSKAFTLEGGTFTFDPKAAAPATAMPLGDRWKIICDMVRQIPVDDLRRRLGPKLDAPVMKSGGRVSLQQLKLTPQEARATSYFDGVRSLNALCAALPNEADTILRTAFLLYRLETCSFSSDTLPPPGPKVEAPKAEPPKAEPARPEPPKVQRPEPPRGPPPRIEPKADVKPAAAPASAAPPVVADVGAAAPSKPPVATAPNAAKPPVVPAAANTSKPPVIAAATNPGKPPVVTAAKNPGKPPVIGGPGGAKPAPGKSATPPAIAKPAGAALPGNDVPALKKYWEGMKEKNHFQLLGVAETVTSPQVKTAYFMLAKAFHPDTVPADAPPEVAKLKADIFARVNEANAVLGDDKQRANYLEDLKAGTEKMDAGKIFASEELFQKACILVKARKYPEAVKQLDEAIALYDREGEYFVWRGWARFLVAADKKAIRDDVLKEIDKGLKISPRCAQGIYFKGQIHKLLGDATTAQKLFKETLAIDPNHIEAQRETRQR